MPYADVALRPANKSDACDIARVMRAALGSFAWMPTVHTPDEDLAFISGTVLPRQRVTVANSGARRFYERHGFTAAKFGDGSGNEEKLPDIQYLRRS